MSVIFRVVQLYWHTNVVTAKYVEHYYIILITSSS